PAKLPASLALAALLALSACPGTCQALECGGGIDMPSQPEIAASHVRALSASLDGIAGTDAFDAAEECAEFIRQLYQLRLGSFPQSLSIAWSSLKDAAAKQLAGAAREALDYACGYVASNAKASVDGVLGKISARASDATLDAVRVSRTRGLTLTNPAPAILARQKRALDQSLPRWRIEDPGL
ncbi:MAG: hypothetical protein II595_00075, partial [Desulfovibrio sp.]|nr:hypothetical protein [Desulfovibrio sp.]